MVLTLAEHVDSRRLAAQGTRLAGEYPAAVLTRLTAIFTDVQPVAASIDFSLNAGGRVIVRGHLNGWVTATCQRCLAPVTLNLKGDFEHLSEEEEGESAEQGLASVAHESESSLDLLALIEDEMLLACPMVPMHPHDQCGPSMTGGISRTTDRENPFDVLSALRQNKPKEPRNFDADSNTQE